jgi:ATP-dependent protease ClpP protease subunit
MSATTPSKWYSIRRLAAVAAAAAAVSAGLQGPVAEAEVYIYGDIGESWWQETVTAAQFVKDVNALDVAAMTVRINSVGGSAMDGIAIYNAIKRHKAYVTIVIDALAASIASLIAMAGDQTLIADNAMLMVHGGSIGVYGNAGDMRNAAEMLDQWNAAMSTSYASKTGKPQAEMLALLVDGKDHWYTAAEAVEMGFCDATTEALPITASLRASVDLSRYGQSVPAALKQVQPAAAAAPSLEHTTVTNPNPNPAADPKTATPADIQAATQAGIQAEAKRRGDIRAALTPFMGNDAVAAYLATAESDVNVTVAAAKDELLKLVAKGAQPANANRVETVMDERDKLVTAHAEALMARAGVRGKDGVVKVTEANPFRGMRLLDIARASLHRVGVKTEGMDVMRLVGAAFNPSAAGVYQGTTDFPVLLENTLHKTLQMAYAVAPDTWSRWCRRGSVSDFRAHPRYRVGSLTSLDAVNENGEFKYKAIPDGEKSSITATTKGNILTLTRQLIINDDLQALTDQASALGRAGKRTIETDAYALLVSNPTLVDGIALFHASHGNLPTAAAPSVTAFDAARVAMALQKDVGGNDYLDLTPAIWLGPKSLGGTARVINASEYDPDTANKLQRKNMVNNLFRDIVDSPRLSGTGWYTFADPNEAPVIEVAFLDGNDTMFLDTEQGFSVDGALFKGRIDFGVAAIDYRGAQFNAGA